MRPFRMTLTVAALALGLAAGVAQAMPLANSAAGLKVAADESNLIVQVDACNRVCRKGAVEEWGGSVAWHRHVSKACRPVHCKP
jgi:hypothetical protein